MKRTGLFFFLALAVGCSGAELKEFSPDGKFKVMMPGSPQEKTQAVAGMQQKIWATEERAGALMVAVTELPMVPPGAEDAMLDGGAKGGMGNMGGTINRNDQIQLAGKYPGRAVEGPFNARGKQGNAAMRIYMVKNRMYLLMALGEGGFSSSPDAVKFLDSLQIVSE